MATICQRNGVTAGVVLLDWKKNNMQSLAFDLFQFSI